MCRSIKTLREGATPAPPDEIRAAALQYVRKVSGFREPASHNKEAFEAAVDQIAKASEELLGSLVVRGAPAASPSCGPLTSAPLGRREQREPRSGPPRP